MKPHLRLFPLLLSGFACAGLTLQPAKHVFGQVGKTVHREDVPETTASPKHMPVLFEDDFEKGLNKWEIVDSKSWALQEHGKGMSLSITKRDSEYEPKVRSPRHIALMKDVEAASFVLKFKVKSTKDTGNHRDCCVFFCYENASRFYYVHLGAKPDPHSGQIMIVKDAPRLALTENKKRTPWTGAWHDVKLVRDSKQGTIEIYFDDMTKPHMTVRDKTFGKGRIGIGSFDDMNAFDEVELRGQRSMTQARESSDVHVVPFGGGGQVKMLYDARQRPPAVYLKGKLHIVFNGGGIVRESKSSKRKAEFKSMAVTYDPLSRQFSEMVTLGKKYSSDHHDGPVVWADMDERLHVFYGWHHDRGTHLISDSPRSIGSSLDDWSEAPAPAPKMSYPWTGRVYDNKQLVFYRTDGHYSSWSYRITSDNGRTWEGPETDVIDLDQHRGMDTDWSSYLAKEISKDGNFLHVGFIAYDDYKRPRSPKEIASGKLDKTRLHNPLYDNRTTSNYKHNLYYVKIDLRTHQVVNDKGEVLQTPIDLETANSKCLIWDTKWRGGGIIPTMIVDEDDQVSFLHNLSEVEHEKSLGYHYVRLENGEWKHTRITDSNHHWNCGHLAKSADGVLHAYLLTGDGYFEGEGNMDRYGGGNIDEWTSTDHGNTWKKARDLTPDRTKYPGWKYNNIQPVRKPDGTLVDGMLLFYGWGDASAPEAKAFLLLEE